MNRIFRLVWSRAAAQRVPVAEAAGDTSSRASSRRRLPRPLEKPTVLALAGAAIAVWGLAQATPTGAQITSGSGSVSQSGNTTTIQQSSSDLFLSWQSFNVSASEVVNFVQPSSSAIAVNRILGNSGSQIFGHLNAIGQVWLINPNGMLFGKGAQINVGGLTATTLDVNDVALGANVRELTGSGTGSIVNEGAISATEGGYVALVGNQVENFGVIRAQLGTVALGAGSTETLTFIRSCCQPREPGRRSHLWTAALYGFTRINSLLAKTTRTSPESARV
jgi:trimeric autotransporter adhesin